MKRDRALVITQVTRHQYYYQPYAGKRGRKPSKTTEKHGNQVDNECVTTDMKANHQDPDLRYGYQCMSKYLQMIGYKINHKKVYRLMKHAGLLRQKKISTKTKNYVKYRVVVPQRPLQVVEMDIKMVWVTKDRRHAYILTIIDTFTRRVLYWSIGYQMQQYQVKEALRCLVVNHLQPADLLRKELNIEFRNDNGKQFSAKMIREFMKENHINQVFTHPYTPQENGHVESFHSILKRALGDAPFWSFMELEQRLCIFYKKYNNVRLHGSIAHLSPVLFEKCWEKGYIDQKIIRKDKKATYVKFSLTIERQQLSGIMKPEGVSCLNEESLDGTNHLDLRVA